MARFQQKLLIPSSTRPVIARADILAEIEESAQSRRVTVIAAPAGWGKTTTLVQWARAAGTPIVWYTLDPSDRDPRLFLDYLLHGIAPYIPDASALIHHIATCSNTEIAALFRQVALSIASAPQPFAIVLDDLHTLLPENTETSDDISLILSLLSSIAEYAMSCHLIIASRTMPLFHGMVRLIAQQRATVLDYGALRFRPSDVQALASISRIGMIGDQQAQLLCDQLGGWVCGIVLSLDQSNPPPLTASALQQEGLLEAHTGSVYAYLADQVIHPLPRSLQQFLEDTSVLDDLSAQHCDALRRATNSARYLDQVVQRGLFVTIRGEWVAYHSLFREFLRSRLAKSPDRERQLLLRAAEIFARADNLERAIESYLECQEIGSAYALLRSSVTKYRQLSRQKILLACFDRLIAQQKGGLLPADLLIAQARVCAELALWDRAFTALHLAETIGSGALLLEARIMSADLNAMLGNLAQAQDTLVSIRETQMTDRLRFLYKIAAGRVAAIAHDTKAAIAALEEAHAIITATVEAAEDPGEIASMYDFLGWVYAVNSERITALRYLRRADACWQAIGNSGRRTMTLNNLGMIALEDGRMPEARAAFETGLQIAQQTDRVREATVLHCSMAEYHILTEEFAEAHAHYTSAYRLSLDSDIQSSMALAAAGALWVTTLQRVAPQPWLEMALAGLTHIPPEAHQRIAIARATCQLPRAAAEIAALGEAVRGADGLSALERAAAALIEASLHAQQSGWELAADPWRRFLTIAEPIPAALIRQIASYHQPLLALAAERALLPAGLLPLVQKPATRQRWRIQALGSFSCRRDDQECDLSPIHRALLVRLLDAGSAGVSYESLWETVWGDALVSRSALDSALSRLRTVTGLAITTRSGICAIRSAWEDLEYDVQALERLLRQPLTPSMLHQISHLYQGAFFPGAPLSASLWVEARRAQLQQQTLNALDQLAQQIEREAPAEAIRCYQQILRIDGCREHTAMQLMQLAHHHGNRRLVTDTFEQLRESLRSLNIQPQATTTAFYRKLV
jgi:ATP/maltotriose-dependent transcriptional regulator MalT/DNA-binding SARP family transcriptional activator